MRLFIFSAALSLLALSACNQAEQPTFSQADLEPAPLTIYIEGMTCESCNNAVDQALNDFEGITGVKADYITGKATMMWQAAKAPTNDLLAAIDRLGYKASLQPASKTEPVRQEAMQRTNDAQQAPVNTP